MHNSASIFQRQQAFTYIEIVILVTLLGIVALLALPNMYTSLTRARISGAADEIQAALEFAHLSAVDTGRKYRVTVDPAADTLRVARLEYGGDLTGVETELPEADVEREVYALAPHALKPGGLFQESFGAGSRHEGIDILSADFGSTDTVVFDARGAPSGGGSVTLASGQQQIVITLDAQTGKVTRSD